MRSCGTSSGKSARERVSGAMTTRCVSFRCPIEVGLKSWDIISSKTISEKPLEARLTTATSSNRCALHPDAVVQSYWVYSRTVNTHVQIALDMISTDVHSDRE